MSTPPPLCTAHERDIARLDAEQRRVAERVRLLEIRLAILVTASAGAGGLVGSSAQAIIAALVGG